MSEFPLNIRDRSLDGLATAILHRNEFHIIPAKEEIDMKSIQDLSQPIIEIPPSDVMDVIQIILTNEGQNPLNPEINRIISEIETIHEKFQKHNHVHVCNQISGFRQVVFTGAFLNTNLFRKSSNDLYISWLSPMMAVWYSTS